MHHYRFDVWSLSALALGGFLPLALHEAGHLLGGFSAGFRFVLFIVGPLRVEAISGRLEFSFNKVLALWGGVADAFRANWDRPFAHE